jgi:hypothetical protein
LHEVLHFGLCQMVTAMPGVYPRAAHRT